MTATVTRVLPVVRSQASGAPIWSNPQSWLKRGSLGVVDGTRRSSSRSSISRTGARQHSGERADGLRIGREKGHMAVSFRKLVRDTVNTAGVGAQTERRGGAGPVGGLPGGKDPAGCFRSLGRSLDLPRRPGLLRRVLRPLGLSVPRPRRGVPDPRRVVGTPGEDVLAVGAERHARDHGRVPLEGGLLLPRLGVP